MGNRFICMSKKDSKENGSRSKRVNRSQRKLLAEDEFLHRQALSMAIHQHQLSQRFDGSMSRRIGSTSSRRTTLPDSVAKQVGFNLIRTHFSLSFMMGSVMKSWFWKVLNYVQNLHLVDNPCDV
jgi:hypothetical protein